eukprot:IDg2628t1
MADRMRSMMKRSGSTRGSMTHMGTTPYKYNVEIVVSHIDNIKTAEVCLVWDRRGRVVHTALAKVSNSKATSRETLSMETTLFRLTGPGVKMGVAPAPGEELHFDEKRAKLALRRGGATGKALDKIVLNLADYIKAPTSTLFADLKLSNDAVASVKIEARFLHVSKKRREGGDNESDGASEASELDAGGENDSIFGDDADDLASLEIEVERDGGSISGRSPASVDRRSSNARFSKRASAALLKESPSGRNSKGRTRTRDKEGVEMRRTIEALRAENEKLKRGRKSAIEEIDALREELASAEELRNVSVSSPTSKDLAMRKAQEEATFLRKRVKELQSQNENLVEELEDVHRTEVSSSTRGGDEMRALRAEIQSLRRSCEGSPSSWTSSTSSKWQRCRWRSLTWRRNRPNSRYISGLQRAKRDSRV